jgi:hypothetical protein
MLNYNARSMRRALLLLPILFASCATSNSKAPAAKIPQPSLGIEQEVGPRELGYPNGPIEVKYNFAIQNNAAFPITLRRIDLRSGGIGGGAYTLQPYQYNFNQEIPPNSVATVTVWAKARGWGHNMRETEPVTVRGVVHFDSPQGGTQKVFVAELSQYGD